MHVTVLTPPQPYLELDEVKAHLRVEGDDDDTLITGLIAAACGWLDGPAGWLGRSIGVQTLELRDRAFACDRLPYGPVIDVEQISYLDSSGAEQPIADDGFRALSTGVVLPLIDTTWPATYFDDEAVRITYTAGYAPGENDTRTIPPALIAATLLIVGFLYANREASADDALQNGAVRSLLSPYQVWSI